MTTTNTSPNGARAKILRALLAEGMLTTSELATHTGLRPDQERDNAVQARKDGLVTSERDDVTGLVAYKVTAKGCELCTGRATSLHKKTPVETIVDAGAKEAFKRDMVTIFAPPGGKGVIDAAPAKCQDCASTEQALDLAQNEIARHRDEAVRLSVERDEARREANRMRELAAQMEAERDGQIKTVSDLRHELSTRDAAVAESDAAINERLSKYDALVGENNKLATDIANLHSVRDKQRRTILALESRAPSPMVTEYVGKADNSYVELSGSSREEAIEGATDVAGRKGESVLVYGMVLIGTVEIRPVFVESES